VDALFNSEYGQDISLENNPSFVQSLAIDRFTNLDEQDIILKDANLLFNRIFGYQSKSFIAPNYIWSSRNEQILSSLGIRFIQGVFTQKDPLQGIRHNYLGKTNQNDQLYLIRNVFFEPSSSNKINWVKSCMVQISDAFELNKPAIICSHRVNFIGSIFEENRIYNLRLLDQLLLEITTKWPNVEFMTSAELGVLIEKEVINF
jgi:hypothetical protein